MAYLTPLCRFNTLHNAMFSSLRRAAQLLKNPDFSQLLGRPKEHAVRAQSAHAPAAATVKRLAPLKEKHELLERPMFWRGGPTAPTQDSHLGLAAERLLSVKQSSPVVTEFMKKVTEFI